jgi:hypothetical protein
MLLEKSIAIQSGRRPMTRTALIFEGDTAIYDMKMMRRRGEEASGTTWSGEKLV